jgi:hypothetical protein
MKTWHKVGIAALVLGGAFAYTRLSKSETDKFGNNMVIDNTPAGSGHNVVMNGNKIPGWIIPGTLKIVNGFYTGIGGDNKPYYYNGTEWVLA